MDNCSSKKSTGMGFDDLYHYVASFGVYQNILFFGSCILIMQLCGYYVLLIFVMGTPNFHCVTTNSTANMTCIPNQCYSNCTEYAFDGPFTSIVNEWHFICDEAYKQAIIRSCFYVGDIVGSLVFGILSDKYGRKKAMFAGTAIMVCFAFGSSFSNSPALMGFLWFVTGVGVGGVIVSQVIYFMEIVGPKYRAFATTAYEIYWVVGAAVATLLAYFIRDWRMLTIACSLPAVIVLFSYPFVPETPRWLLAHDQLDESFRVLQKCRHKNKNCKAVEREHLKSMLEDIRANQLEEQKDTDKTYTIVDLVKTPTLRKWTLAVCFQGFVTTNLTHGMRLYVTSLSGDIYVNVLSSNCLSVVVFISYFLIIRRFGRRVPHGCTLLIIGILCLIAAILPNEYGAAKAALFLTATCLANGLWVSLDLFISELFPTVLRNKAQGVCSMTGRIGGFVAPYIDLLANLPGVDKSIPVIIFTILSFTAAVVTYWIPETINAKMHQTIEEAVAAPEDYGIICCKKQRSPVILGVELISPEGENNGNV